MVIFSKHLFIKVKSRNIYRWVRSVGRSCAESNKTKSRTVSYKYQIGPGAQWARSGHIQYHAHIPWIFFHWVQLPLGPKGKGPRETLDPWEVHVGPRDILGPKEEGPKSRLLNLSLTLNFAPIQFLNKTLIYPH